MTDADDRSCRRPIRHATSRARSTSAGSRRTSSRPTAPARPADPDLPPFTIIQPPPNVTGSLHLGHAQRTAVEDLMIRHARMRGHAGAVPAGPRSRLASPRSSCSTDHRGGGGEPPVAGPRAIPRADARVRRRDAGRDARASSGGSAPRPIGARLRFTMDEGSATGGAGGVRAAVPRRPRVPDRGARQLVPGLPDERVSDLEVVPTPETGTLWTIRYHLIDEATGQPEPDATIAIATTRPETILGDIAVAVHPEDAALPRPRRPDGPDPVRGARRADHRRRGRRAGVRDRAP